MQVDAVTFSDEQLAVLASAQCNEVFEAIPYAHASSIREIAKEVDKSTASVGEHLVKLVEAGLVLAVDSRKRRAREETLYARSAFRYNLDPLKMSDKSKELYVTKFRCEMRQIDRLHALAQKGLNNDASLIDHMLYKNFAGYLSPEGATKVKEALVQALRVFVDNMETDPAKRESGHYVRAKFAAILMPAQTESERRIRKKKP
ncbi:MAG: ArsR family transcriptional regulator [Armatimonadetes bacterium]|nr:ArsR family transcriptional regulator [Armatimonadota bacterium]MBS1711133.1 ArsR family transcriptional regulator [Armatimonadota bacterium]MBX3108806.1 ArsR family transcriptional regulator [Fimbriimonadaceae bacterium]